MTAQLIPRAPFIARLAAMLALGALTASSALAAGKKLKVFILAGQSNMQGHAKIDTFDYLGDDPASAPLLAKMRDADGKPRVVPNVWISSVGCQGDAYSDLREEHGQLTAGFGASKEKIGPELTFGITVGEATDGPVLLIKTSWGGRSLMTDFRPPGAGERVFSDYILARWKERGNDVQKEISENQAKCGVFYRHMIEHVKMVLAAPQRVVPDYDTAAGFELAGFVWFQGFNDYVDGWSFPDQQKPDGYAEYGQLLAQLIRDVRKDLATPKLPVVIGVMGIGGTPEDSKPPQSNFRQAQLAPTKVDEFKGNVVAVPTAPFWSAELGAIDKKHEQVNQMRYFLDSKHKDHANADGHMTDEQKRTAVAQYEAELITPAEAALWKRGASNAGYHYLGCAKTFALAGRAFAEANLALLRAPGGQ